MLTLFIFFLLPHGCLKERKKPRIYPTLATLTWKYTRTHSWLGHELTSRMCDRQDCPAPSLELPRLSWEGVAGHGRGALPPPHARQHRSSPPTHHIRAPVLMHRDPGSILINSQDCPSSPLHKHAPPLCCCGGCSHFQGQKASICLATSQFHFSLFMSMSFLKPSAKVLIRFLFAVQGS